MDLSKFNAKRPAKPGIFVTNLVFLAKFAYFLL